MSDTQTFNTSTMTPSVILCAPLYGQNFHRTPEERRAERDLVHRSRLDPAVKALFNLIERKAFEMQSNGVQADATTHDQGQACGALYLYQLTRAWLESPPAKSEDQ
jgi:hypothetical protein